MATVHLQMSTGEVLFPEKPVFTPEKRAELIAQIATTLSISLFETLAKNPVSNVDVQVDVAIGLAKSIVYSAEVASLPKV